MKKVIFVTVVVLILIIIGSWYTGNKQGSLSSQSPEISFVSCTNLNNQYIVWYPNDWENLAGGCGYFRSLDDRGRAQNFLRVEVYGISPSDKILPYDKLSPSSKDMRDNLEARKLSSKTSGFTVDGLPAYQDPGNKYVSKSVVIVKGDSWFTLSKGNMTSDTVFEKFVKSFHFVN